MDFKKKAYLPPLLLFSPKENSHGCPHWGPGGNGFVSTAGKGFTPPLCSHSLTQRHCPPHMGTVENKGEESLQEPALSGGKGFGGSGTICHCTQLPV